MAPPIVAADFAKTPSRFPFGVDPARTSQTLRALADSIDAGEVALQGVTVVDRARLNDFVSKVLILRILEKTGG